ncbi:Stress responsive alpha-beta barrel domain protein Dabb [Salinispira pacifica]|uniref:Stress responsive alpha-beta barrel domain protein Dabb n=2 Tax=Salinispira pacifica TaxID=1307761 RepID=V5WCT7_9SPIO|nr:Stress responsive alpha-beta barrel domain protein Dabb [Salinispira pacifica]
MWKFKDDIDGPGEFPGMKKELEALVGTVPGLISLELGLNENSSAPAWDVTLRSEHESPRALEEYRVHPAHKAAAERISSMMKDRAVVDYRR